MLAVIFDMDGVSLIRRPFACGPGEPVPKNITLKIWTHCLCHVLAGNKQHMREVFREQLGEDFPVDAFDKDAQKEFRRIEREEGIPVKKGARELLAC